MARYVRHCTTQDHDPRAKRPPLMVQGSPNYVLLGGLCPLRIESSLDVPSAWVDLIPCGMGLKRGVLVIKRVRLVTVRLRGALCRSILIQPSAWTWDIRV